MTDPPAPPLSTVRPVEPPPAGDVERGASLSPAGAPARPRAFDGRAHSFRQEQAKRRSAWRERIVGFLVVAIFVVGVYVIVTVRTSAPSSGSGFPSPGPPVVVHLGTPSVSTLTCGAGGTAYAERITWMNSSQPITTGDVIPRVYEIWDGDIIGDPGAVANVTSSNLCAGAPPDPTALWYVVLAAPNGTNLLTYTAASDWTSVTHGPSNLWIENGSALILVTGTSLAGTGRGFAVVGNADGSPFTADVPL